MAWPAASHEGGATTQYAAPAEELSEPKSYRDAPREKMPKTANGLFLPNLKNLAGPNHGQRVARLRMARVAWQQEQCGAFVVTVRDWG